MFNVKRTSAGYDIYYKGELQYSRRSKANYEYMVLWYDVSVKDTCPYWLANTLCKNLSNAERDKGKGLSKELNYIKYIAKVEY